MQAGMDVFDVDCVHADETVTVPDARSLRGRIAVQRQEGHGRSTRQLRNDGARWGGGRGGLARLRFCTVLIFVHSLSGPARRLRWCGACPLVVAVRDQDGHWLLAGYWLPSAPTESFLHSLHAHALTLHSLERRNAGYAAQRNASSASPEHIRAAW